MINHLVLNTPVSKLGQKPESRSFALVAAVLLSALATNANAAEIFSDSMNYADNAAITAAWGAVAGSAPTVRTTVALSPTPLTSFTPSPASGSFMSLGNGVRFRALDQTVTQDWTLEVKMLQTSYGRVESIYLLNESGSQGYGIAWQTTNVNQNSGRGLVQIVKFNNSTYTDWATFGVGTALGVSVNSTHPVTGYTVTAAPSTDQNAATYDTSTWLDFLDMRLEWAEATGQLTLFANDVQVHQFTDTEFSEFSRVYVRGNTNSYFDSIVVSAVPEPSALAFAGIGLLFFIRRKARR